jgi:hypothetical protein
MMQRRPFLHGLKTPKQKNTSRGDMDSGSAMPNVKIQSSKRKSIFTLI